MIVNALMGTAERAREYLDEDARRKTIAFVKGKWNPDGGVCGRSGDSDLYSTAFAAMVMRALIGPVPKFRLWNYLRSFGTGESLDLVHLFCLIRLRSIFPMTRKTRNRLVTTLQDRTADSATDMFFKIIMGEFLHAEERPEVYLLPSAKQSTSDIAAAAVINGQADVETEALLLSRHCEQGGFYSTEQKHTPTLEATAKALFAMRILKADLSPVHASCIEFVESMRRDSGGYSGTASSATPDVENTFYALLCLGCLVGE